MGGEGVILVKHHFGGEDLCEVFGSFSSSSSGPASVTL